MEDYRKKIVPLLVLCFSAILSVLIGSKMYPSVIQASVFFDLGGVSSLLENSLGTGAFVLFKIIAALGLAFAFRKSSLTSVVPLAAVVFLLPPGGETLALPFIAVCALGPLWSSILAAVLLPFFSKLALIAIFASFGIRYSLGGKKVGSFAPLLGLISPPMIISIFSGQIFLPFLLSACSFPPYSPVSVVSPLFALFLLSAVWLYMDEKPDIGKVLLTGVSFFFTPLAALPLLYPASVSEKKHKLLKLAFIVPIIWTLAAPQKNELLPKEFNYIISSLKSSTFTIAAPPLFHDEIFFILNSKSRKGVYPAMAAGELVSCYKSLPVMPPFLGYQVPESDLLLTRANYPGKNSARPLIKGWKLISCSAEYSFFAKEAFLKGHADLRPLTCYSPYSNLSHNEEDAKMALEEAERLMTRNGSFYEALRDAGRLCLDLNQPQKAELYFKKALNTNKTAEIYNDLGVSLANSGRPDKAMEAYLSAMNLSPKDIYPRMNYASAALAAGKQEEAVMVLQDVIRAYPTFYPAARFLSQIYSQGGNVEKARELLSLIPRDQLSAEEISLLEGKK
jgi:tetratricopeptide (TPR) repeat protein